jgi:hypothetical protein
VAACRRRGGEREEEFCRNRSLFQAESSEYCQPPTSGTLDTALFLAAVSAEERAFVILSSFLLLLSSLDNNPTLYP